MKDRSLSTVKMGDNIEKDQDRFSNESWLSNWEEETIHDWESESNMDERVQMETESYSQKLWQSFQNSATAIAQLYRDQSNNCVSLWVPFQNSASCVTLMYKDSLDIAKKALEIGIQCGQHRRNRDLLTWAKKRRRNIRKEDLIAHLCGRNPPVRHHHHHHHHSHRPSATLTRANSRISLTPPQPVEDDSEPDLQPFRDALALQGLNGAMSNVSVDYPAATNDGDHTSGTHLNASDEFHCFLMDQISRRCGNRKRTSQNDVIMDSPTRKRSRLL